MPARDGVEHEAGPIATNGARGGDEGRRDRGRRRCQRHRRRRPTRAPGSGRRRPLPRRRPRRSGPAAADRAGTKPTEPTASPATKPSDRRRRGGGESPHRARRRRDDQEPARGRVRRVPPAPARSRSTRRRRFSLPPLDDDHEKVNRSIETFLASGEPAPDADAAPTTRRDSWRSSPSCGPRTARPLTREVAETLERELRAAARGTDRVERRHAGRWRVILAATGELAARAYLRAVRAAMEPALDERHPPLRLVAATATVLDEPSPKPPRPRSDASPRPSRRRSTGGTAGTTEPRAAGD